MSVSNLTVRALPAQGNIPSSTRGLGRWEVETGGGLLHIYLRCDDGTAFVVQPMVLERVPPERATSGSFLESSPHISADEFLQLMLDSAWERGLRPTKPEAKEIGHSPSTKAILGQVEAAFEEDAKGRLSVAEIQVWDHWRTLILLACGGGKAVECILRWHRSDDSWKSASVDDLRNAGHSAALAALGAI